MYFKQFYLGCLAHASYLVGSEGEAAVVDPQRDIEQYLSECEAQGLKIKYIVETHLHADFVSGHCELAARTGAEIVFGHLAGAKFPHRAVRDGDELRVGRVRLRIMETPGHTPESISVLVIDTEVSGEPQKVLTGDTLFVGDVGRPDLAGSRGYTTEMMASMLYDSLHEKLLRLDDRVEVYPAHGAGSMCGRNISKETSSTIGQQRRFNYALAPMPKAEFVSMMTTDLPEAPAYFSRDAELNRAGAPALGALARPAELSPEEVFELSKTGHTILDVRSAAEFGAGHVPGALNVGLGGQFAIWAGSLIPQGAPLVVVAENEERVDEALTRLARVGVESVKGYLGGGTTAWEAAGLPVSKVPQISVAELHARLQEESDLQVVDVRRPMEYQSGHVPGAQSLPLSQLKDETLALLDPARSTAVICAGGYRSSAATSILARSGFQQLFNVTGGTSAYVEAGYKTVSSER
ncbi:MAG TPA: rhodanese-like domain-containing protein [Pyrinomonadaceae bacterium]|jgi:glyoxylase-like metal-dependent hydrolase (beta-lactamase superfamily II)/rhodanese-related sulfurtransferase